MNLEGLKKLAQRWRPKSDAMMFYDGDNHGDTYEAAYNQAMKVCADELDASVAALETVAKLTDAVAMHSETPQILPKKPGEPGGEKARVRGWLEGLTYESSNGGERGLMPHHIEQFTEKLAPLVAGALAACALAEAKWWKLQIESRIHGINFYQHKNFEIATKIETERIERLERAAEGESLGKPEGRAT